MKRKEMVAFMLLTAAVLLSSAFLAKTLWIQAMEERGLKQLSQKVAQIRKEQKADSGEELLFAVSGAEKDEMQKVILPEFEDLVRENPDLAGWIRIKGTRIDYPVMQTLGDREYYLHRNFKKEKSFAGVPFVGAGDLSAEGGDVFIYGHNMKNQTMFAELLKYQEKEYWEEHPGIELDTLWERQEYQIFTVFPVGGEEWSEEGGLFFRIPGLGKAGRESYIKLLIGKGAYETGIMPETDDPLVFLITCSYQTEDGRFVIVGVKI